LRKNCYSAKRLEGGVFLLPALGLILLQRYPWASLEDVPKKADTEEGKEHILPLISLSVIHCKMERQAAGNSPSMAEDKGRYGPLEFASLNGALEIRGA
jgi:hypothetical protein